MLIMNIVISLITAVLVSYRNSHINFLWLQGGADSGDVAFTFRKVPHPCSKTWIAETFTWIAETFTWIAETFTWIAKTFTQIVGETFV